MATSPVAHTAAAAEYVRQRIALMSTHRYKIAGFSLCTLDIEFQILRAKLNPPDGGPFSTEVMRQRIANLPRVPPSWVLEHPESMVSFLIRFLNNRRCFFCSRFVTHTHRSPSLAMASFFRLNRVLCTNSYCTRSSPPIVVCHLDVIAYWHFRCDFFSLPLPNFYFYVRFRVDKCDSL